MKNMPKKFYVLACILVTLFLLDGLDGCNNAGNSGGQHLQAYAQHNTSNKLVQSQQIHTVKQQARLSATATNDAKSVLPLINLGKQFNSREQQYDAVAYAKLPQKNIAYVITRAGDQPSTLEEYAVNSTSGIFTSIQPQNSLAINTNCTNCTPRSLLVSPSATHKVLYVLVTPKYINPSDINANTLNTKVITYDIDQSDGHLTKLGEESVFKNKSYLPTGLTISPDGNFLYIVNTGNDSRGFKTIITTYPINSNGTISPSNDSIVENGVAVNPLVMAPNGKSAALILNVVPKPLPSNPSNTLNTIQRFKVNNGHIESTSIVSSDVEKDVNDDNYILPAQILFSPDSENLFVIFKDTNLLATYNNNLSVIKKQNLETNNNQEFRPLMITTYKDINNNSYLIAANKSGLWKETSSNIGIATWSSNVTNLSANSTYRSQTGSMSVHPFDNNAVINLYVHLGDHVDAFTMKNLPTDLGNCNSNGITYDPLTHTFPISCQVPLGKWCDSYDYEWSGSNGHPGPNNYLECDSLGGDSGQKVTETFNLPQAQMYKTTTSCYFTNDVIPYPTQPSDEQAGIRISLDNVINWDSEFAFERNISFVVRTTHRLICQ